MVFHIEGGHTLTLLVISTMTLDAALTLMFD